MTNGWILIFAGMAIAIVYAFVSAALETWARYSAARKIDRLTKSYGESER